MEPQPSTSRESPDDSDDSPDESYDNDKPSKRYPQERYVRETRDPLSRTADHSPEYRVLPLHDMQRVLEGEPVRDPQRLIKDREADKELAKMAIVDFDLRHKFRTSFALRKIYAENRMRLTDMYHKIEMARYGRRIKRNSWERDLYLEMDVCLSQKPTKTEEEIEYMRLFAKYKEGYTAIKSYEYESHKFHMRCVNFFIKYPWRRSPDVDVHELIHAMFPSLKLTMDDRQGKTYFMFDNKLFQE